jgi:hypothetical protein
MPTMSRGTNVQPVSSSVQQRLVAFEVTGRLVQHHPAARAFFDKQELAVAFDDGGHGDVRFPYHGSHYSEPACGSWC